MSFFSKEPFYLGIETTNSSIRIALLERNKKIWRILSLKELSLKELSTVSLPFVKKSFLTTVLSQRQVMMRTLSFDLKKESDVRKAIDFHIEPQLPFPLEEAILQAEITPKKAQGFTAAVHAVKGDTISQHLEMLSEYQLNPDAITSPALSLTALLTLVKSEEIVPQFMINIGEDETTVLLVRGTTLLDQRSFVNEKNGVIGVQKALLSLETQHPKEQNSILLLFGKHSHQWVTAMQEATGKYVHTPSLPFDNLSTDDLTTFAVAIGAAISQTKANPLHFRQKAFKTTSPYKFIAKPLFLSFLLTFLSIGILLGAGNLYLNQKQKGIQNQLAPLLEIHKTEQISLSELKKPTDYEKALTILEKNMSSDLPRYTLEAKIAPMSEVMHWLSEEISQAPPPLQEIVIESIDYKMIHRPTPLLTQEHYQVQIEMHFLADSPNVKEGLVEFLQNSSFIVNEKEDIEVSFFEGKGKAQFILKDSTRYESHT